MFRRDDKEGAIREIWNAPRSHNATVVDFGTMKEDTGAGRSYELVVDSRVPEDESAIVYFHSHPVVRKKLFHVKPGAYITRVHKEMNARFDATTVNEMRMGVFYKNKLIKCRNVVGHIYLMWAVEVASSIPGGVEAREQRNVPFLLQTMGDYKMSAIVLLMYGKTSAALKIPVSKCRMHWPTGLHLVRDVDCRVQTIPRPFRLETKTQAIQTAVVENRSNQTIMITTRDPFDDDDDSGEWLDELENSQSKVLGESMASMDGTSDSRVRVTRMLDGHVLLGDLTLDRENCEKSSPQPTPRFVVQEVSVSSRDEDEHDNMLETSGDSGEFTDITHDVL